ncbi:MAG: hypothetical protein HQL48_04770 [Gammaproteobacteria bacterium]|nr:hypothetical protein [Gammaproteobacteria bacterium]
MITSSRKISNQEKAWQAELRVDAWIARRDELGDYWEYERDGKVSRAQLQDDCDIGPSVMKKGGNPRIQASVRAAEDRWYSTGSAEAESLKRAGEAAEIHSKRSAASASQFQDEIVRLKVEVRAKDLEIARLREQLGLRLARGNRSDPIT